MLTAFTLGLLAAFSPCVLPLYPGYLAYLSGSQVLDGNQNKRFLGFFVLAGVLVMMLLLGALIALLSISVGRALSVVIPIADLMILVLGVFLLLDINPFKALPQIRAPVLAHPFANAFVYGLLYGPIALPCSGPLVVGIFAYSFTVEEIISKLTVFLWFGLGFGLPLLILSFMTGSASHRVSTFLARHSRIINLVGGMLLVGIAVFDLIKNWDMITAYLGG